MPANDVRYARQLVMTHGWNATCYQILNPGILHWFSVDSSAVVGYVKRPNLLVVAGAPVCASPHLKLICAEFETYARELGCRVCYVCAEERLRSLLVSADGGSGSSHSAIALGAQPAWDPADWDGTIRSRASLRAQLNRSRNKGVTIENLPPEAAASNSELQEVTRVWLASRGLPPLHFLVEPNLFEGTMTDRIVLIAKRQGAVVAFLVASPIAARQGYQIEMVARTPAAPNGTTELLIDSIMRQLAETGHRYATLGLVALAQAASSAMEKNPRWLQAMMKLARLHANRFYNFRGLEQFRLKMLPHHWEPLYAVSNERHFSISVLYGMGSAFSEIPPWLAIGIAVAKAARTELRRTRQHTL